MARPKTGQTPPISFRPPPQLLKDFDATIEEGRSRSDVLIELMHDRVTKKQREQEKLRQERDLLLTTFDPSEFGFPADSGSFAALAEHVNRATPERPVSGEETSG